MKSRILEWRISNSGMESERRSYMEKLIKTFLIISMISWTAQAQSASRVLSDSPLLVEARGQTRTVRSLGLFVFDRQEFDDITARLATNQALNVMINMKDERNITLLQDVESLMIERSKLKMKATIWRIRFYTGASVGLALGFVVGIVLF